MKAYIEHIKEIVDSEPNDAIMGGMIRKYFSKVEASELPPPKPNPLACQMCKKEVTENTKSHVYQETMCNDCVNKIHESERIRNNFMNQYRKDHALCPKCKSSTHSSTLAGFIFYADKADEYKDLNNCVCSRCGDRHTTHERVSI